MVAKNTPLSSGRRASQLMRQRRPPINRLAINCSRGRTGPEFDLAGRHRLAADRTARDGFEDLAAGLVDTQHRRVAGWRQMLVAPMNEREHQRVEVAPTSGQPV